MGITICSGVGFLAAVGCAGLYDRKSSFLKPFVCGTVFYFFCYILWSMLLFVTNQFTLFRAVLGTAVVLVALLTAAALLLRRKHGTLLRLLHWDESIRTVWIPLVIVLVALPLILTKNELFGMGQDQGVYQVVAINLMNGLTDRQQDFAEYYNLSSADQTEFADAVRNYLMGYDIVPEEYPDTIYDRNISPVSGIYHGIPTYAAMLALFGKLFGISHMIHLETVIWVCMIFLVSFVCRQMQWKRCTEFLACAVCAASPIVIWVAKSSLTELFLAVILLSFVLLITAPNRSHGLSILPVAVFACYHVSIYTMIPLFVVLYGALYLFRRKREYAVLMLATIPLYLASYFAMRHVQPFYTMNNYRDLFVGGITVYNITTVVTVVCIAAFLICGVYCWILFRREKTFDGAGTAETLGKSDFYFIHDRSCCLCITESLFKGHGWRTAVFDFDRIRHSDGLFPPADCLHHCLVPDEVCTGKAGNDGAVCDVLVLYSRLFRIPAVRDTVLLLLCSLSCTVCADCGAVCSDDSGQVQLEVDRTDFNCRIAGGCSVRQVPLP